MALCLSLFAAAAAAPCRVIVHDDDDNTQDDVTMILQHLGLTAAHALRTTEQIMRRGEAVVLESTDQHACIEAVAALAQFGLTVTSDGGPGTIGVNPNSIDDLVHAL